MQSLVKFYVLAVNLSAYDMHSDVCLVNKFLLKKLQYVSKMKSKSNLDLMIKKNDQFYGEVLFRFVDRK